MPVNIENLGHAYGRLKSLEGITARAEAGRITAVLGPNAAGKSTLLRCVIGALRPSHGRVVIDGLIAHRTSARGLARHLAYVPQRSQVSAAFTVRQVIELGRFTLPPSDVRVNQAIEHLDLADVADRPYLHLSVGQQQRVTLARALAQLEPNGHLILDEPMAAMDLRHLQQAMRLLRQLANGGATILVAMHDLPLAANVADDAWVLENGRLVLAGPVAETLVPQKLEPVFGVRFANSDGPLSLDFSIKQ